jgi:hypothetical protein
MEHGDHAVNEMQVFLLVVLLCAWLGWGILLFLEWLARQGE